MVFAWQNSLKHCSGELNVQVEISGWLKAANQRTLGKMWLKQMHTLKTEFDENIEGNFSANLLIQQHAANRVS